MTTIATAFNTLPLSAAMLANLDSLGYVEMTQIQAQSLPVILKGLDLIAQAKTGSGKTAAFGIGLLNPINPRYFGCQALVMCPTRELADQVAKEIRRLARAEDNIKVLTLCGGVAFGPQIGSLEHGAHIIVGTPGRIQQHLRKGSLILHGLNTLILDEADRMLDMGFYDSIEEIIAQCPERRQTLLFSATYPVGIKQLASKFMRNPQIVKAEAFHDDTQIEQRFYEISPEERMDAVTKVLSHFRPASCVAFCFTKQQVQETVDHLTAKGISAVGLHGDLVGQLASRAQDQRLSTEVARIDRVQQADAERSRLAAAGLGLGNQVQPLEDHRQALRLDLRHLGITQRVKVSQHGGGERQSIKSGGDGGHGTGSAKTKCRAVYQPRGNFPASSRRDAA